MEPTANIISPYLEMPLRTLDEYKRDRTAQRMAGLFARMRVQGVTLEDLRVAYVDEWLPEARHNNYCDDPVYLMRSIFQQLRINLTTAKGNWPKAMEYTLADATALGERLEEEDWNEAREQRLHGVYVTQLLGR